MFSNFRHLEKLFYLLFDALNVFWGARTLRSKGLILKCNRNARVNTHIAELGVAFQRCDFFSIFQKTFLEKNSKKNIFNLFFTFFSFIFSIFFQKKSWKFVFLFFSQKLNFLKNWIFLKKKATFVTVCHSSATRIAIANY